MSSNSTALDQPVLQYSYVPTEWITITFLSLFGVSTLLHLGQALYFRMWWLLPSAVLCGILECIGWSGRVWSSSNPYLDTPFLIQIVTLIIGPTPLVAANFMILARIIRRLGPQYSRLSPRLYAIIFVSCDFISLVVQGAGGGISSDGQQKHNQGDLDLGANIALGGTIFQLVAIAAYCTLAAEFLYRHKQGRPVERCKAMEGDLYRGVVDMRLKLMLQAMLIMTVFIVIRTIYRVLEFVEGWTGEIMITEWPFNVFDGAMIVCAMFTLNFFHPGFFLQLPDDSNPTLSRSDDITLNDRPKESSLVREV